AARLGRHGRRGEPVVRPHGVAGSREPACIFSSMAQITVLPNPQAVGEYVADNLLQRIDAARAAGRRFLLGSPTGRTPKPIYAAMAERLQRGTHDLGHVTLVIMDEYLVQGEREL